MREYIDISRTIINFFILLNQKSVKLEDLAIY